MLIWLLCLEEKISIFKKRNQPVTIINQFGDGTLPSDVYRLGTLSRLALTNVEGSVKQSIDRTCYRRRLYKI